MSPKELQVIKDFISTNLKKGFIRPSSSPTSATPIIIPWKNSEEPRVCIDYCRLNAITIPNRHTMPLISEILERLGQARIFTKLDLHNAYNLLHICPGYEHVTAFSTRFGTFEFRVTPFGLLNSGQLFCRLINAIFHDFLDDFLIAYLDDLLIFSNDPESHVHHVQAVLQRMREHHLSAKLEKCEFHTTSLVYLGYRISLDGLQMDPEKI
ncbi:Transposon Ty3-G Gag-Pol polyprotein [Varanus komodoensis]|nr:Transposon Ty3-G Gag-Pol polyprotein [Varanus komodoensis]